jgi:hypothetical protein
MATDILLKTAIFGGDPLEVADLQNPNGDEHVADPVGKRIEKMQLAELDKNVGVSFAWSTPVSLGSDEPTETKPRAALPAELQKKYPTLNSSLRKLAREYLLQKLSDLPGDGMELDEEGSEITA